MNANSEWLEESDPDDPPTQSEGGGKGPLPPSKTKAPLRACTIKRYVDEEEAVCVLPSNIKVPINSWELLRVAINLLLFFQRTPGPSLKAAGVEGRP